MYKSFFKYIPAVMLAALFGSVSTGAQLFPAEKIKQVEQKISAAMSKNDLPGFSVAIVVQGKIVFSNGYGLADIENYVPAKATTVYRTGSIGKPMTATAVMQLVERGKLDLDAPIQKYCPSFPEKQWILTSRHLLAHVGGVRHYGGPNAEAESFSTYHYKTIAESLNPFKNDPLLFEPGTSYSYSTYGYNVLGCVMRGASGKDYLTFMKENIFGPANMSRTRDDDPSAIVPNRTAGYIPNEKGGMNNSRMVDMSNRMPAGGFVTTAEDLASFAINVMNYKLISQKTFEQMLTPQKTKKGDVIGYGLGWGLFSGDFYGEKEAFHGGQSPGVSTMLYILPKLNFAVAFQANVEVFADRTDLAADIATIVLEPKK